MAFFIGVDGGTESLRAAIFDLQGNLLFSAASPYETQYPRPGWAEQRPSDWWRALGEAVRDTLKAAEGVVSANDIAAICLDTTCCTVVPLGADGEPLRPALLWMDMRSAQQAARVAACSGDPALRVNSGGAGPVSAEWMLPKSLWIKENELQVWAATACMCEYQDYLNARLTGRLVSSRNNAGVRWHHGADLSDGSPEAPLSLLARLGIEDLAKKWPKEMVSPGEVVGGLTREGAAHLGLPEGLCVAQGGADAFIGMLGLGVVAPGQMALLTGSSHLQLGIAAGPMSGKGFFGTYKDVLGMPGVHVIEGGQTSTGSILAWFRRTFCPAGTTYRELDEEAAAVPPGCEGLVVQDHFQGNRTPHTDPLSRGALAGLTLAHGRGHVFRALMEGVAFGSRQVLEAMAAGGYRPDSITIAGGAARSPLWLQIHADVCRLPLVVTKCGEAPMLGCAVLAAVASGHYPDIPTAAKAMVEVERVVLPNPDVAPLYDEPYRKYCNLYGALVQAGIARPSAPSSTSNSPSVAVGAADATPSAAENRELAVQAATASTTANGHAHTYQQDQQQQPQNGRQLIIAPSILAADFADLGSAVQQVVAANGYETTSRSSDSSEPSSRCNDNSETTSGGSSCWVHVDMFDGTYCGNWTIGPPVLAALRRRAPRGTLTLDCHLALQEPEQYLDAVAKAGADNITFHWEVLAGQDVSDADRAAATKALAGRIRSAGCRAGLALAPDTLLNQAVVELAQTGAVDMVLLMTVQPGFGGQAFVPSVLSKVSALRVACPSLRIQVDGGVNAATIGQAAAAGADVFVAGSAVFGHKEGVEAALRELRSAAALGVSNASKQQ